MTGPQEQAARTAEYLARLESCLESLASSWENQAADRYSRPVINDDAMIRKVQADMFGACAQQLREAIAHGGQG